MSDLTDEERRRLEYIKRNELARHSNADLIPLSDVFTSKGTRTRTEDTPRVRYIRAALRRVEESIDDANKAIDDNLRELDGHPRFVRVNPAITKMHQRRRRRQMLEGIAVAVVIGSLFGIIVGLALDAIF
jgi:hypothetical protein